MYIFKGIWGEIASGIGFRMEIYLIFVIAYSYCETIKCNVYRNLYFFIVPFLVGGLYVILRKVKRSIFYKNKEL